MSMQTPTRQPAAAVRVGAPPARLRYVSAGWIFVGLVVLHFALAGLDLATYGLDSLVGSDELRRVFSVDAESSIPTWVSASQALIAAGILGVIAAHEFSREDGGAGAFKRREGRWPFFSGKSVMEADGGSDAWGFSPPRRPRDGRTEAKAPSFARHWLVLAVIFAGISVEEIAAVHEVTTLALGFEIGGLGGSSWVVPGVVLGVVLLAFYVPFLKHLPGDTLRLVLLAAVVTAGGGMGMEAVTAVTLEGATDGNGPDAVESPELFEVMLNIEELLERLGIALFIYALLRHIAQHTTLARVTVPGERTTVVLV
jgi:hypothetical protein